jgi:hypothetical protein
MDFYPIVIVVVVMAFFIAYAIWSAAERRKAMAAWAAEKGLQFS